MSFDELNKANIDNLTCLWKKMGVQSHSTTLIENLHISISWPNRCWFDWQATEDEISAISNIIFQLQKRCIVPVWGGLEGCASLLERILMDNGFELLFQQTAMYLSLENNDVIGSLNPDVVTINSQQDIETWTHIAAHSFEYEIDVSSIRKIACDSDVQLLLAYVDGQAAATAMLFRTGDNIGVHQVGVAAEWRGKGVARTLMHHVIEKCYGLTGKYITLQASEVGENLYRHLGFKPQFMIKNYQRFV